MQPESVPVDAEHSAKVKVPPIHPATLDAPIGLFWVWYKHRDDYFIPAYAQGIAIALVQLPVTLLEASMFSLIMYFMLGFYTSPAYFFTFCTIAAGLSLCVSAMFRFIGCISPTLVLANAYGAFVIMVMIITSGFIIIRGSIPAWMIWGYYISPYSYTLRAMVINEFTSPKWQSVPAPSQPNETLGNVSLQSLDFFTDRVWIWGGVAFLYGMYLLLTFASILSLAYQDPIEPRAQLPDEKQIEEARRKANEQRKEVMVRRAASTVQLAASKPAEPGLVFDLEDGGSAATPRSYAGTPRAAASTPRAAGGTPRATPDTLGSARQMQSVRQLSVVMDIVSSLPFQKITLAFIKLRYFVPNPKYSRRAAKAAAAAAAAAAQDSTACSVEVVSSSTAESSNAHLTHDPPSSSVATSATKDIHTLEHLELLKGITGFAEPGVLTALMGGSGAGKTTLMDVVAGRKTIGSIKGDIFVNGHPKQQRSWSRVVGYCEQQDIHSPAQTVVEALAFSARMRLPESISLQQVTAYVNEVLDIVDMMDIMYNLVGTPGVDGLSVEQRKRLTIAVELVSNPSVIFMDEPTSGLDARAASTVIKAVRKVARNGRTIMVTIHQPSIEIFETFDMLLLIQQGGLVTYFGPLGIQSLALVDYLCRIPGTPGLPNGYNPATWMLEVTGGTTAIMIQAVNHVDWPAVYSKSELCHDNSLYAAELVLRNAASFEPLVVQSEQAMPFKAQCKLLFDKYMLVYWRSPGFIFSRLIVTLVVSFVYSITFYKRGRVTNPSSAGNIQNIVGIIFGISNFLGMANLVGSLSFFSHERVVFYRERAASMYDAFAFGVALALVEVPYVLAQTLLSVPLTYWMVGFKPTAEAFFHYFIMFFEILAFYSIFGQFLVYVTPSQGMAQVAASTLNFLFNTFSGFMILYISMPAGWRWMNRLSPLTWVLYGLGISQTGDNTNPVSNLPMGQSYTVAELMEYLDYSYDMRWWCVFILLGYIVFIRVTSILALKYWNFLRR